MLDGAIVIPLQSMIWNLLFQIGSLMWIVGRALLNVGYFIMSLTGWITQNAFVPLLSGVSDQTEVLVGPIFVLALTVLGFTYILAVFGRFEVVDLRSAVTWLVFAAFLYTLGPGVYTGMEAFRRLVGGGFYEAGIDAFNNASGATGLNAIGATPADVIAVPTDQFGPFLPGVPGATAVDGLDVAMSYAMADGYDALAILTGPHPIVSVPYQMAASGQGGFFDPVEGPNAFGSMADADRQASIGRAVMGVWRLLTMWLIGIFGIVEQLINFLMTCAFAVAFFSMFIAVLFGFFRRTEPIASAAFNLIIELFIQSILNSFLMSLILGFVMVGANTANAILLLGTALVGLWMSFNLLKGCVKGLTSSTDRIFKSFSTVTGGNMATVGETNQTALNAAVSAATGASVLAGGGGFLQAAGAAFGDQRMAQTMNYAARMLGGEDTLLGSAAQSLGEGASARGIGGPLGGYLLGRQTADQQRTARQQEQQAQYRGTQDEARDEAVQDYRQTGEAADLSEGFAARDIPRVQALSDQFDEEEFDTVAQAARRVRNANPGLPPQSPGFQAKLRQALPSPLREMEDAALGDFAQLFGAAADPSAYQSALANYQIPVTLGPADIARDQAVAGQMPLQDAFSPDDANRVAQLMDAYDDDDFAALTYAVRAARETNPDDAPGSIKSLQATRAALPPRLQATPSRDLTAFSRAFGGSPTRPAVSDEHEPAAPYIGSADRDRDGLVDRYLSGDHNPAVLRQGFSAQDAMAVGSLLETYQKDEFDSVVKAVRQARTDDPDRDAGSPAALRATRQQLPPALRQMPSEDLEVFSRTFGTPADLPGLRGSEATDETPQTPLSGLKNMTGNSRQGLIQAGLGSMEKLAAAPVSKIAGAANVTEIRAENWQRTARAAVASPSPATEGIEMMSATTAASMSSDVPAVTPVSSSSAASPAAPSTPISAPSTTPITGYWGMKPAQKQALVAAGLDSVEALAAAPRSQIMAAAQVSEQRATDWQMTADLILDKQKSSSPAHSAASDMPTAPSVIPTASAVTPTSMPSAVSTSSVIPVPAATVAPVLSASSHETAISAPSASPSPAASMTQPPPLLSEPPASSPITSPTTLGPAIIPPVTISTTSSVASTVPTQRLASVSRPTDASGAAQQSSQAAPPSMPLQAPSATSTPIAPASYTPITPAQAVPTQAPPAASTPVAPASYMSTVPMPPTAAHGPAQSPSASPTEPSVPPQAPPVAAIPVAPISYTPTAPVSQMPPTTVSISHPTTVPASAQSPSAYTPTAPTVPPPAPPTASTPVAPTSYTPAAPTIPRSTPMSSPTPPGATAAPRTTAPSEPPARPSSTATPAAKPSRSRRSSVEDMPEPPDVPPLETDDGPPSPEDVLP